MSSYATTYDFVLGMPRSGTTLVGLRLNKLSGVISLLENRLLVKLINDFKKGDSNMTLTRSYIKKLLSNPDGFPYSIEPEILNSCWINENTSVKSKLLELVSFVKYDDDASRMNHVVEKNPGYSLLWKKLHGYFPDSKFVWMTRDPRGFVNSRIEKVNPNNKVNNPYFLAFLWNEYQKEYLAMKDSVTCCLVKYEELVSNPESELERLIEYFGWNVSFKVDNLIEQSSYKDKLHLDSERMAQKYEDLERKINTDRVDAWKTSLSPKKSRNVAFLCEKTGNEIGYQLINDLNWVRKLALRLFTLHWWLGAKLFVWFAKRVI